MNVSDPDEKGHHRLGTWTGVFTSRSRRPDASARGALGRQGVPSLLCLGGGGLGIGFCALITRPRDPFIGFGDSSSTDIGALLVLVAKFPPGKFYCLWQCTSKTG